MKRMQSMLRGAAAAALAAATIAGCGGSGPEAPPAQAATIAPPARPASAPVSPAPAATGRSAGHAELEALGARLLALERAMAQLERRLEAADAGRIGGAPRQPSPSARALSRRNDPTQRAEDDRAMQALTAERESAFRAEPMDTRWALSMQTQLQQALTAETETPAPALRSIECRSRTCRVELLAASGSDLSGYLPAFASRMAGQLDSMSSAQIDLGNGSAATVIYLSSQGARPF